MASKGNSAPTSKDVTAKDADGEDFAPSITGDVRPLRRSKRLEERNLTLPGTISCAEHTLDHKDSKQGGKVLQELPLDVLHLVADLLDAVARTCLEYALGCWPRNNPGTLSACAKPRLVVLLRRDGSVIPKELLEAAERPTLEGMCSEYNEVRPRYCSICRCRGHLSHCPGCGLRTCAREDTEFWRKRTGTMNGDKPS